MGNYLSTEASEDFLHYVVIDYHNGNIGKTVFLERLAVLAHIGERGHRATVYASSSIEGSPSYKEEHEYMISQSIFSDEISHSEEINEKENSVFQFSWDDGIKLYFSTNLPGLSSWVFHQYDDDPFPSIPHGHSKSKTTRKLDVYQGWVYQGARQIERLDRKTIIILWNDEKFRKFAYTAIYYYHNMHSHYSGWKVSNYLKLPRKKK